MVAGGVRVGHQDGRASCGRQFEHRSPRPREDEVTGRQAVTEVWLIFEDVVPGGMPPVLEQRFDLAMVAVAGHVNDLVVPVGIEGEALDCGEIDRAGPVATPENEQAGAAFRKSQASTGILPVCLEDHLANRATSDFDPTLTKAVGREGEADPRSPAAQQPGGEAGAAIGLHQDERHSTQARGDSYRPGDETPSPDDDLGPRPGQEPRGPGYRNGRQEQRPQGLEGVLPVEALDVEQLDRVAGIADEILLGATARTCEKDFPAPVTKRVGDGQGGYDVARRPAGRDHDRIHL